MHKWLLILTLFVSPVQGTEARATIVLGEEANWPPFTLEPEGIATKGLSLALMQLVFERLDVNVKLHLYPMKRVLLLIQQGRIDGATVISRSASRDKFLVYSDPIFQKKGLIYFSSPQTLTQWQNYHDLKGLSLSVVLGNNYGDEFNAAKASIPLDVIAVRTIEQSFQLLALGRVDAVLAVDWSARAVIKQQALFKVVAADKPYFAKDYHIGIGQASPFAGRLEDINRVISEIKSDGSLNALLDRYIETDVTP